ncbi:MAG: putative Ig domain-containing protein [Acidobacteriota bacterium]|nr:putative Ig domain-containing protein [Acidobacteriota bacterium]
MCLKKATRASLLSFVCVLAAFSLVSATSVIIPSDDQMIIGARAIVRGQVVAINGGLDQQHQGIFTYVTLRVQEVFKGKLTQGDIIIKEPGGQFGNKGSLIFGTAEFKVGEDVLLFLDTWPDGSLRVYNWFLGKYSIIGSRTPSGQMIVRNAAQSNVSVVGRSQTGTITDRSDWVTFATMLRSRIAATKTSSAKHEETFFKSVAVRTQPVEINGGSGLGPTQNFTFINPNRPPRWFEPDNGQSVTFKINPAGAPNGTIFNDVAAAMNAWSSVSGSAIRVVNGGSTNNCGLLVLDGENTISFNNCDNYSPFSPPAGGGCSGILAAAGIISYDLWQTRVVNGITFYRALEGNLSFNPYASCYFSNACNVQEIATHELGHALGVGHSLDSDATMYAYAHFDGRCASLRTDDANSMRFIYPGTGGGGGGGVTPVSITTTSLPTPQLGSFYSQTVSATGGTPPYTWSVSAGALPSGLNLSTSGTISGTPVQAGTFTFTLMVRDAANATSTRSFTLQVNLTCNYSVSPTTFTIAANGGSGTVNVTVASGCSWSSSNSNSWITVQTSSGNGNGSVTFTVAANSGATRTGTITVANQSVTITQNGQTGGTTTQGLQFYPLPYPVRLFETRPGLPGCVNIGTPIQGQSPRSLNGRGACNGVSIPANAQAIAGNFTAINSTNTPGYGTVYPTGGSPPNVANVNYKASSAIGNSFITALNASGQFSIFTSSTVDAVIDITGYFAPPGAGGLYYHPLPKPVRLLDTRPGQSGCDTPGTPINGRSFVSKSARVFCDGVTIPAAARAVTGNFAVVNQLNNFGFGAVYPTGVAVPQTSNVNYDPYGVSSSSFVSGLSSGGQFNIYVFSTVHAVVDISGYFSTEAVDVNGTGLLYQPLQTPMRLLDTRAGFQACDTPGQPIPTQTTRTQYARTSCYGMTIPSTAMAIAGNFAIVNELPNYGFGTLYPTGNSLPVVSNINYVPFEVRSNSFITGLSGSGHFNIYPFSTLHVVIDVAGYFAP